MAGAAASVAEGPPRYRDEAPVVARLVEGQLQDAEVVVLGDLAVGDQRIQSAGEEGTARADHELPNSSLPIHVPARAERREALVVVAVCHQGDLGVSVVERLPERLHACRTAVVPGAVARMVPIRQRAVGRMRSKIGPEPALLCRAGAAAAGHLAAVRVERDQMPAADVEAVIALAPGARRSIHSALAVEVV